MEDVRKNSTALWKITVKFPISTFEVAAPRMSCGLAGVGAAVFGPGLGEE